MSTPEYLPADLGGWQHLEPDVIVEEGDIMVRDGKPNWRIKEAGCTVKFYEEMYLGFLVYRKMEVAKQGDLDDRTWKPASILPTDAAARKKAPIATGVLDYFPLALCAVAELSVIGNKQHGTGDVLTWDRSKSGDEADALMRHLMERGKVDTDGVRHSTKVCWRAMALLQKELESERLTSS